MKIAQLSLLAILGTSVFTACKSEEPEPTNADQLSGQWELIDLDLTGTVTFGGQTVPFVTSNAVINDGSYFDFSTSPDVVDYDASATVTIEVGTSLDVPYARSGQGNWTLKGRDSLIIEENNRYTRYGIISWTDTKMILRSEQVLDYSGQAVDAEIEAILQK